MHETPNFGKASLGGWKQCQNGGNSVRMEVQVHLIATGGNFPKISTSNSVVESAATGPFQFLAMFQAQPLNEAQRKQLKVDDT
jgi:hypothetical protein